MNENMIKVYVKLDENNVVVDINSEIFLKDLTGWICIDEGAGDKYAHAQGNYLEKGLMDDAGRYNYKYIDSLIELSEEEKAILFPDPKPVATEIDKLDARITYIEIMMEV